MKQLLLIFVKNAIVGKVKTRLAATLGDATALSVYKQLLAHTMLVTRTLQVDKVVCYSHYLETADIWDELYYAKQVQQGEDLGARMENAFESAFSAGYERVVIIGSDCMELSTEVIEAAFDRLGNNHVVLGPALDGGYYLLGTRSFCKPLFRGISWSTGKVLEESMKVCNELGLETSLLPVLSDIDNAADLRRMGDKIKW